MVWRSYPRTAGGYCILTTHCTMIVRLVPVAGIEVRPQAIACLNLAGNTQTAEWLGMTQQVRRV